MKRQAISLNRFDQDKVVDLVASQISFSDEDGASIVVERMGKDWKVVQDAGMLVIAKDMGDEGVMDYESVVEEVSEEMNMDEDELEREFSRDDMKDVIGEFLREEFDDDIVALGSQGRLWGIEFRRDMLRINVDLIVTLARGVSGDELPDDYDENDIADSIVAGASDKLAFFEPDTEWLEELVDLGNNFKRIASAMDVEWWLDELMYEKII